MKKLFFFGCGNNQKGHYLFESDDRMNGHTDQISDRYGINRRILGGVIDSSFAPAGTDEQSKYQLSYICTTKADFIKIVSWWDRTGDSRPGSNSSLIGIGYSSAEEMIDDAYVYFPMTMGRMPRPTSLRTETMKKLV
jgi:hypothetical protein